MIGKLSRDGAERLARKRGNLLNKIVHECAMVECLGEWWGTSELNNLCDTYTYYGLLIRANVAD